ncbi:MAG: hypothetical protein CM15mV81_110 [uncultured marine virus]|nr:MAG: hypothetical protein CM15mV81_110 [uncultured marine virus]
MSGNFDEVHRLDDLVGKKNDSYKKKPIEHHNSLDRMTFPKFFATLVTSSEKIEERKHKTI